MSASAALSSKALTELDTIIDGIEREVAAKGLRVTSAVKELVQGNLAARESAGGRPSRPVWQARAAVELLEPWWQDEALDEGVVSGSGDIGGFVSSLLTKMEGLWSDLFAAAAGDPRIVDDALEGLAAVSSSGVNPRRTANDAVVQAAIDLLSGIRLELRG